MESKLNFLSDTGSLFLLSIKQSKIQLNACKVDSLPATCARMSGIINNTETSLSQRKKEKNIINTLADNLAYSHMVTRREQKCCL